MDEAICTHCGHGFGHHGDRAWVSCNVEYPRPTSPQHYKIPCGCPGWETDRC